MSAERKVGLLILVLAALALTLALRPVHAGNGTPRLPKDGTCKPSGQGCPFGPPPVIGDR